MSSFASSFLKKRTLLAPFIETFQNELIEDEETLLFLLEKPELLKSLIPPMGPRLQLILDLEALKRSKVSESCSAPSSSHISAPSSSNISAPSSSHVECVDNYSSVSPIPLSSPIAVQKPSPTSSPRKRVLSNCVLSGKVSKASTQKQNSISTCKKLKKSLSEGIDDLMYLLEYDLSKKTEKEKEEMEKYLTDTLNETKFGKTVLRSYELNKFDDNMRKLLVDALINYEWNAAKDDKISSAKFKYMACAISAHFKGESPFAYYIPSVSLGKSKKINAKGTLYQAYLRRRRVFKKYNGMGEMEGVEMEDTSDTEESSAVEGVTEEDENDHSWLKRQSEPFEELAKKWEGTFLLRQNNLQENCKTIREYINTYPALKRSYGHHLISLDFEKLYPTQGDNFVNRWPMFVDNIIEYALTKANTSKTFKTEVYGFIPYLLLGKDSLSEQERNFAAISLLPLILKPGSKNPKQQFTKQESFEKFILLSESASALKTKLQARNEVEASTKTPIQPLLVFVGALPNEFDCHVEVEETIYDVDSVMQAVDRCFKCFFPLHLQYPVPCFRVWLFIQRHLYRINIDGDKPDPDVEKLASNLKLISQSLTR